ncbi:MAG: hypothetical protein ABIN01_20725 [Ferruginibacter sp.]
MRTFKMGMMAALTILSVSVSAQETKKQKLKGKHQKWENTVARCILM